VQGRRKTAFDLRQHSSLAQYLVARMEDLQSGASRTRRQGKGTRLRYMGGVVSAQVRVAETIWPVLKIKSM